MPEEEKKNKYVAPQESWDNVKILFEINNLKFNNADQIYPVLRKVYNQEFKGIYETAKKTQGRTAVDALKETNTVDDVVYKLTKDPNLNNQSSIVNSYEALGSSANEFLSGLRNGSLSNEDITGHLTKLQNAYGIMEKQLDPENSYNKSGYVLKENKLYTRNHYDKMFDGPQRVIDKDHKQVRSSETADNPNIAYAELSKRGSSIKKQFTPKAQELFGVWNSASSSAMRSYAMSKDDSKLSESDVENAKKGLTYNQDLLGYVLKYGTLEKEDRLKAKTMISEINEITDPRLKYKYMSENSNRLGSFVKHLGYSGTKYLFDKHNSSMNNDYYLGKNDDNEEGEDTQKNRSRRTRSFLENQSALADRFKDAEKNANAEATNFLRNSYKDSDIDPKEVLTAFLGKDNKPRSFEEFKNEFEKGGKPTWSVQNKSGDKSNFYEVGDSFSSSYAHAVKLENQGLALPWQEDYWVHKYNELTNKYKKEFNKVKSFGDMSSSVVAYKGLDFNKETSKGTSKQESVNAVVAAVRQNIGKSSIGIKAGNTSEIINNFDVNFNEHRSEKTTELDSFLKASGENVTATFYASPGGSKNFNAYVLKDEDTGKQVSMFIPNSVLSKIKDPLYMNSSQSNSEFVYNLNKERKLEDFNVFKDVKLYQKDGEMRLMFTQPSSFAKGSYEKIDEVIGTQGQMSWETAAKLARNTLNSHKENFKK